MLASGTDNSAAIASVSAGAEVVRTSGGGSGWYMMMLQARNPFLPHKSNPIGCVGVLEGESA